MHAFSLITIWTQIIDSVTMNLKELFMPKHIADKTKTKRMLAIIEVIDRAGRLSKANIDERVAGILGCKVSDIKKSIYNDLTALVSENSIIEERFTPDGVLIEDYDPEKHKNTRCEYISTKKASDISGIGDLKSLGANILVSDGLKNDVQITEGGILYKDFINIHFQLEDEFINIKIKRDAIPVSIIITRIKDDQKLTIKDFQSFLGKRCIVLTLPTPNISSYKSEKHPGHARINITKDVKLEIMDYGSKNQTYIQKLTKSDVDNLLLQGKKFGDITSTKASWASIKIGSSSAITLTPLKTQTFELPLSIDLSTHFRLLIN